MAAGSPGEVIKAVNKGESEGECPPAFKGRCLAGEVSEGMSGPREQRSFGSVGKGSRKGGRHC